MDDFNDGREDADRRNKNADRESIIMKIQLFQNPNGYYLYDAVANRLQSVSETLYSLLKSNLPETEREKNCEYRNLRDRGFFSRVTPKLRHPYRNFYRYMIDRGLTQLVLQISQGCNMRCGYCPYTNSDGSGRVHREKNMSYTVAKRAVDFFLDHSVDMSDVSIAFYGGEPLLNADVLCKTIDYAKERFEGKTITFHLITNGTLLTDSILDLFEQRDVHITISYDGPRIIHDRNRKFAGKDGSTHDVVMGAIRRIYTSYPGLKSRLLLNMVMDPRYDFKSYQSVLDDLPEGFPVEMIQSYVVNNQGLAHTYEDSETFSTEYQHHLFLNLLYEKNNACIKKTPRIMQNNGVFDTFYTEKALSEPRIDTFFFPAGTCIPGHRKLFVNLHGTFLPCEKVPETHEALHMGNLEEGYNYTRCEELLNVPALTEKECADCWSFRFCLSCLLHASDNQGFSKEARLKECALCKERAVHMIYRYLALQYS